MPGERMTAGDRALLAFLRKRYTSATISRESEALPGRRISKRGRPKDDLGGFLRAIDIFWTVELKRNLRSRFLTQSCKLVAAEMQAAGENMQWETVRKIHRKMVRYYKFEAAFPLEESLAAVRKRRGGDMTYRKSFHKAPLGFRPPRVPPSPPQK